MPISFQCECGKPFTVGDEHAGKRTKCPKCGAALTVPAPPSAEDEAFRLLAESPDPEPLRPALSPPHQPDTRTPAPPPPRPAPAPKLKRRGRREERAERPRITISAGVLGGLGAMLLAGIWFAVGWANDRIYFYPPVLFIFGLVAVVRGLLGYEEE